jgi:hypothetical protein
MNMPDEDTLDAIEAHWIGKSANMPDEEALDAIEAHWESEYPREVDPSAEARMREFDEYCREPTAGEALLRQFRREYRLDMEDAYKLDPDGAEADMNFEEWAYMRSTYDLPDRPREEPPAPTHYAPIWASWT